MTLRVALVGCGKVADQHLRELQKLCSAHVVAVCDREPLMAAQLAMRFGVPKHYSDFGRLLKETQPDVVHLATPPQSHVDLAREALDAGCHLVVEKPLAVNSQDAHRLVDYVIRKSRKMTIGYIYYFDPVMVALRELMNRGILGEVVHLDSFFSYDLSGSYGRAIVEDKYHWVRSLPGGLIHNVLDHLLIKITEIIPDQHLQLYVDAWEASSALGLPDELRLLLHGRDISASVTFSSTSRPLMHRFTVFGTKNTAHLDLNSGVLTLEPNPTLPGAFGRISSTFSQATQYFARGTGNLYRFARSKYHPLPGLAALLSTFYSSIESDGPLPIPYSEMLRVSDLIDEIVTQMYSGLSQSQ